MLKPIRDWFKDTLRMVAPDARGGGVLFFDEDHHLTMTLNEMLGDLDTGISHLGSEQVPSENIQVPEALEGEIQEQLGEGRAVLAEDEANNQFLMTRKDGELVVKKRVTVHRMTDGTEARFEVSEESDGSQRLINLLPAFLDLSYDNSKRVYVIDEVDRSLHTLLTRRLLEDYLASRSGDTRTQLLLTTHDVLLMDQRWLRRDEMWGHGTGRFRCVEPVLVQRIPGCALRQGYSQELSAGTIGWYPSDRIAGIKANWHKEDVAFEDPTGSGGIGGYS